MSEYQKSIDYILEVMNGGEHIVTFVHFNSRMKQIQKQAEQGDEDSKALVDIVVRFSNLIKIVSK